MAEIGGLVRSTSGAWFTRPPSRCSNGHRLGAGWVLVGHQPCAQRMLDALRDRLRVRAGRDRCPTAAITNSQTVPAADTVPRSSRR
jgi:hypothetical protein